MCVASRASALTLPLTASSMSPMSSGVEAHWRVPADEFNRFVQARAGTKYRRNAKPPHLINVLARNRTAGNHENILQSTLAQRLHNPGKQCEVGTRKNAQPDHIDVLLQRGVGDHLWRLKQSGVNNLHSSIPKRADHHLSPAVMSVEAWFCDQYPNR